MTIEIADLIQIDARVTHLGRETHNVFHYRVASRDEGITYADVANHFEDWWGNHPATIMSANAVLDLVEITNLTNGLDIYQQSFSTAGLLGGADMPTFTAWGFRLIRTTRLTRHGSKRFVGVIEETTLGNSPAASIEDELSAVAVGLEAGIMVSGTTTDITLTPIIIGRTLNEENQYVLDTTKVNLVSGAEFTRITTQNSRKD